jgi:hypothetical protein
MHKRLDKLVFKALNLDFQLVHQRFASRALGLQKLFLAIETGFESKSRDSSTSMRLPRVLLSIYVHDLHTRCLCS